MNNSEHIRYIWVDYAKTIGIFLVILAHTQLTPSVQRTIYVCHMPLFFFLSGFLFSYDKYPDYKQFVVKRARQLLLPYLTFNVIGYLFWLLIRRHFGEIPSDSEWYTPFYGMLYGAANHNWLIHNVPLWFLPSLFCVENLYYLLFKNKYKLLIVTGISLLGFVEYTLNPTRIMPFGINIAITALVFYAAAALLRRLIIQKENWLDSWMFAALIASTIIVWFISEMNGKISMHKHIYNNYWLFLSGAFSGILAILLFTNMLANKMGQYVFIQYISNNTIIILGTHLLLFVPIKAIAIFMFNVPKEAFVNTFLPNVIISIVNLFLCLFIIYIFHHYLYWSIGRKRLIN